MFLTPRPEVANLKICPHGGINYAELRAMGITPESVLDFSVCSNPFMPPPGITEQLNNIALEKYPDSEVFELRQRLSAKLRVPPDNLLAGSGTTELIRLIALTYFGPKDTILILEPTYGEYESAGRLVGAKSVKQWAGAQDNFAPKVAETIDLITRHRPRGVFICNPNNPTGKYLPQPEVEMVLGAIGDGLLILDEAYVAFVRESWSAIGLVGRGNVVILRSMTKDYGLAGLRLGYAIASREIIDCLRRVCPPWNVNVVAQKIGAMVLTDDGYLEQTKEKIRAAKQFLIDGLSRLGFQPLPSDANFFLMRVGNARAFRAVLLKHGILVRDGTSFGLPEYVRIGVRTMPECQQLLAAIKTVKDGGGIDAGG